MDRLHFIDDDYMTGWNTEKIEFSKLSRVNHLNFEWKRSDKRDGISTENVHVFKKPELSYAEFRRVSMCGNKTNYFISFVMNDVKRVGIGTTGITLGACLLEFNFTVRLYDMSKSELFLMFNVSR